MFEVIPSLTVLVNRMMLIRKSQMKKTCQRHRALPEKTVVVESLIESAIVTGLEATAKKDDENGMMYMSATMIPTRPLLVGAKVVANETRDDMAPHPAPRTGRHMATKKERESHPPERCCAVVKVMTLIREMKG
jgi:hypothetical protein